MSSSTAAQSSNSIRKHWIVSPWWDLSYVVVTPLLIVPIVLIIAQRWLTAEDISLAVIAFASLGHHLPGFMRAYGDQELFARYRMRFLLVPPIVFGIALLFSPPASLRSALNLPWTHLHGLELILLLWGTWHGLMQTYGFMRIYDVRRGVNDKWTARLDHWLCLSIFTCGMVFSDGRVLQLPIPCGNQGCPYLGPEWVLWARIVVGGTSACVLLAYLANLFLQYRNGISVNWLKLLLVGITGWFYWYTGKLSTNVLIGLAMFEIYHAIQYYAIVWIYNRRLFQRAKEKFGFLGFMFRDRWSMLGLYLAAIGAYSSIRYFSDSSTAYVFRGEGQDALQWLVAWFVTSSMLHFYFDGFIWQVSEKETQQNLVDDCSTTSTTERLVPGILHAGKLGLLFAFALSLLLLERQHLLTEHPGEEAQRIQALGRITPRLPECQAMLCRYALQEGNVLAATEHGQRALALRPRSHASLADMGLVMILSKRWDEARTYLEKAITLEPREWSYHSELATVLENLGHLELAEEEMRIALSLQSDTAVPHQQLADFLFKQNRLEEAEVEYEIIAAKFPDSLAAEIFKVRSLVSQGKFAQASELAYFLSIGNRDNWRVMLMLGAVLNAIGDSHSALEPLAVARHLGAPASRVDFQFGLAYMHIGKQRQAVSLFVRALRNDPDNFEYRLQLANAFLAINKIDQALNHYEDCLKQNPSHPQLCANLGGLYSMLGQPEKAEAIYRKALAANQDSIQLNYNLGILLLQSGRKEEARDSIQNALELGMELEPELVEVLDL